MPAADRPSNAKLPLHVGRTLTALATAQLPPRSRASPRWPSLARTRAALYAAQLAVDFGDHEILRDLPFPVFQIQQAEPALPFAVAETSAPPTQPAFGGKDVAQAAGQLAGVCRGRMYGRSAAGRPRGRTIPRTSGSPIQVIAHV